MTHEPSGIWLTYFTIKHSFSLTVLTYGAIFGVIQGICYGPPMGCAMKWFPDKKGIVSGLVVAGIGAGAFVFDPIQTAYLNPENKAPDHQGHGKDNQEDILNRVPSCLLMLGFCYGGIQMIGALLLVDPQIVIFENVRHH
ncbi:hypothetical protein KUTeg_012848 [Tegillarca granosa]|uniref:Uncharacterized protein n=1 Tax=Tegillarca granosa TaxID=220873 RepID=A0ABQ9EWN0_TEGGR|nr:hypothetical protein KUTeg_012848 [Tegillarca granosa]